MKMCWNSVCNLENMCSKIFSKQVKSNEKRFIFHMKLQLCLVKNMRNHYETLKNNSDYVLEK